MPLLRGQHDRADCGPETVVPGLSSSEIDPRHLRAGCPRCFLMTFAVCGGVMDRLELETCSSWSGLVAACVGHASMHLVLVRKSPPLISIQQQGLV